MSRQITKGTTDVSVVIRIIDSTDGTPEQAVEHNTAGIDLWYRREGAARTAITEAALAALTTAHTDGGIEHIDDGYYRLDLPDGACASGVDGVMVGGAVTGMIVIGTYIELTDVDLYDGVRGGMTALPNAAADAAGGVPISDAGGLDLDTKLANTNEITAARMGALTDWINGGRLDNLLDAIPTTAMRGTDNAALASVVGALADAAAAGEVTTGDTVMQYIKQLINILIGTPGIGTFPAEAAPGNAVSLAEVVRAIHTDVTGLNGDVMRGTDSAGTAAELAKVPKSDGNTSWNATALAAINGEVEDVLETDTQSLPGQAAPSNTPTTVEMITWLYKWLRNKKDNDGSTTQLYDDAGSTVDSKQTTTESAGTVTVAEIVSGP